jgi:hypothetical protein
VGPARARWPQTRTLSFDLDQCIFRATGVIVQAPGTVRERFGKVGLSHLDAREIEANIEHTQFPVPKDEQRAPTDGFPGLLRAADLIGQLADINYLRKTAALFNEFRETGMSDVLKYSSAADLRANYPHFFWQVVRPYTVDGLRYLRVTQEGQMWIATLYANVFSMEHRRQIV